MSMRTARRMITDVFILTTDVRTLAKDREVTPEAEVEIEDALEEVRLKLRGIKRTLVSKHRKPYIPHGSGPPINRERENSDDGG